MLRCVCYGVMKVGVLGSAVVERGTICADLAPYAGKRKSCDDTFSFMPSFDDGPCINFGRAKVVVVGAVVVGVFYAILLGDGVVGRLDFS